jgi:hypothetical protein
MATSATSRRWQRHHTLSLHMIAVERCAAWSSIALNASPNGSVRV